MDERKTDRLCGDQSEIRKKTKQTHHWRCCWPLFLYNHVQSKPEFLAMARGSIFNYYMYLGNSSWLPYDTVFNFVSCCYSFTRTINRDPLPSSIYSRTYFHFIVHFLLRKQFQFKQLKDRWLEICKRTLYLSNNKTLKHIIRTLLKMMAEKKELVLLLKRAHMLFFFFSLDLYYLYSYVLNLEGTWITASAHIITAVIGSGVLSLAWAIAQLGWVAGPAVLLAFSFITYFTSTLLADCYRSPDPVTGKRNYTYMDVVRANLGPLLRLP